jgi:hypothetical protein
MDCREKEALFSLQDEKFFYDLKSCDPDDRSPFLLFGEIKMIHPCFTDTVKSSICACLLT